MPSPQKGNYVVMDALDQLSEGNPLAMYMYIKSSHCITLNILQVDLSVKTQ